MGAWGAGPFQDDTALDWLEEPFMAEGAVAVKAALGDVMAIGTDEYLEYDAGVAGRAAAEVVATSFGKPDPTNDDEDLAKIARFDDEVRALPGIRVLAGNALVRLSGENSEIAELWLESDSKDEWLASVAGLAQRLKD
ncbi:DUF4259 domain-containing protein [Tabrizicola sp.]|uniref:DUF4259 domain-containing protein n=1 Tax=Tabrizicola sp. TaxID=2005166 RepID=UPI003F670FE1